MSERNRALATRLRSCIRRFPGLRPVVLGDLVVDEFVHGDIVRVSREAPVLVLEEQCTRVVPGGAGNTLANLRALGAAPLPVGAVGRDEAGLQLVAALRDEGIRTSGITIVTGYATPCKSRILAGGAHTRRQQIVRVDRGASRGELSSHIKVAMRRNLRAALARGAGLLIADYGYGAASPDSLLMRKVTSVTRRGLPVLVDSRARVASFRAVTACTPNQEELEQAVGSGPADTTSIVDAARTLLRRTGDRNVLVTRGSKGMTLVRPGARAVHIPPYGSDEVADVTGAGDTVIAVFTLALMAGADVADAARLSNYAAGIVVTKAATATVSSAELEQALAKDLQ